MKKITKLMLMIAAVLMVATGCQKYDDGIDVLFCAVFRPSKLQLSDI